MPPRYEHLSGRSRDRDSGVAGVGIVDGGVRGVVHLGEAPAMTPWLVAVTLMVWAGWALLWVVLYAFRSIQVKLHRIPRDFFL